MSGRTGIDATRAPAHIVVHLVTVAGENEIVFPAGNCLVEKVSVVAMQQGDALAGAENIAKAPVQLNADVGWEELPIA